MDIDGQRSLVGQTVLIGLLSVAFFHLRATYPDAFPAALFLSYRHADKPANGICSNAQCGGDSCHRGSVIGSLLAASAPLPEVLIDRLVAAPRIINN